MFEALADRAGLAWWAELLIPLGPPSALAGLVLTLRDPPQRLLAVVNGLLAILHIAWWAWLIPQLS